LALRVYFAALPDLVCVSDSSHLGSICSVLGATGVFVEGGA
jgi:hypothetical protein